MQCKTNLTAAAAASLSLSLTPLYSIRYSIIICQRGVESKRFDACREINEASALCELQSENEKECDTVSVTTSIQPSRPTRQIYYLLAHHTTSSCTSHFGSCHLPNESNIGSMWESMPFYRVAAGENTHNNFASISAAGCHRQ